MEYDLVVIGAGPAGYSAAVRAAQLGASVALIDKDQPGGTCLNRGCVPTKSLWHAMDRTYTEAVANKSRTVDTLRKGLSALLKSYAIEIIPGTASFTSPHSVSITHSSLPTRAVPFSKCIIAAGSNPKPLPGTPFDHKHIIDSTDALNLTEPPKTMMIIGGGVIGVELATIFARFGTQVKLCERESGLLPGEDPMIVAEVTKSLARLGVHANVCYLADQAEYKNFDKVLIAVGRTPNTEGLHPEAAGITCDNRGIAVNESLETASPGIFAVGDINGRWQLAYTAQAEGCIAAENALRGTRHPAAYTDVPRVIFSHPVCAAVGIQESQVSPDTIRVGTYPFTASGMALIEGQRAGWVKIICDAASGTVLGGAIMGKNAEELITVIALAVHHKLTAGDLKRELFFHPSLSEAIHLAAEQAFGTCVDLPAKRG